MTWVRLDDQFPDHPKVLEAGPAAAWLYICGLSYASRYLTDGFIPAVQVRRLADMDGAEEAAERLVTVGLWAPADDGYQIHDYLDYQQSATKVREEREAAKQRMQRLRSPEVRPNISRSSPSPAHSRPSPTPPPVQAPAGDEDDAPAAVASASAGPESRRLVGDLLVGKPGFRESAEFWAALDELDGRVPLRVEVVKALDWLRDKRKPKVTARFVLGWLEREAKDLPPAAGEPPSEAPPAEAAPWPADRQPDAAAAAVWGAALERLQGAMSGGNFDAYFRGSRGLALEDGHLLVGMSNPLRAAEVRTRFRGLVRRTLEELPNAPSDVRLVVAT